jgi:PBP1b-binding outer membrane lipoprotein LpoB
MRKWTVAIALALLLGGCPDRAKQKEVGHAPKRQLDKVERAVDNAEQKMQQRIDKLGGPEAARQAGQGSSSGPATPEE